MKSMRICSRRIGPASVVLGRWSQRLACLSLVLILADSRAQGGDLPRFREQVVSKALKFGYQLIAVDLNGDGKKNLIAVDERGTELAWFENPTWARHVLATDVPRPLNAACWDIDGDGIPEVVLAYRFETRPEEAGVRSQNCGGRFQAPIG